MIRVTRALCLTFGLLPALCASGCATTAQIERLRAEVQAANDRATAAQVAADAAKLEAQEARAASERAGKAAVDARNAVAAMDQRFDEQFKKSMNP